MKIVLSWLNELAPVGDDAMALAEQMTALGMQVEQVITAGSTVPGVITARVLRTERHPDAAKVHRVWVDAGDGRERHVWCGAFNMHADDIIPLATPGTAMPDGRVIEPRPILGIESQGMLCSASELGLGDDHSGILILPVDTPVGLPYGDALGLRPEVVFEMDLTRNRPDCWGHLGVARDLGAHLGLAVKAHDDFVVSTASTRSASVTLVDGDRCPRFTTLVLSGVTVGASPEWVASRLAAAGMRSINNVVDASNYVMLELNQPNHAYDLDALGGGGFKIRLAHNDEIVITLDGVERTMTTDDLLICDALDEPIGVAGLMGGLHSEITATTTTIALEVAYFEQTAMTRTMNRLQLRSEASGRFERGVDPHGTGKAQALFVAMLSLTCPNLAVHDGAVDARDGSLPAEHTPVTVRVSQVNRILGTALDSGAIAALLNPIGFTVTQSSVRTVDVEIPSWRPDSAVEIDVVEEIARHYGYGALGTAIPTSTTHGRLSPLQQRRRNLREVLLGLGLDEAITESFLSADTLQRCGLTQPTIMVTNPLVTDENVLRPSMRPGLLRAIAFNESHRRAGMTAFEIGHVYPRGDGSSELPPEYEGLAIALAGAQAPAAMAIWRQLVTTMGFGARVDQSLVPEGLHPTRSATLTLGRDVVGLVGEVHPAVLDAMGVSERVAWLELDLSRLLANEPRIPQAKPISRFPSMDIDLALVAADSLVAEKVDKAIRQACGPLLVDLSLFDVYRGAGVAAGSRSLAYRLRLQAADRTLTDVEVGDLRNKIVVATGKIGALLRSADDLAVASD